MFEEDITFRFQVVEYHPMFFSKASGDAQGIAVLAGSMKLTEQVIVSDLHFKGRDDTCTVALARYCADSIMGESKRVSKVSQLRCNQTFRDHHYL